MPTYQYACTACGERLEAVQSFTDDALTECPACGGALRKVFSAVGVVFKGSGFYKNDSRKARSGDSAGSGDAAGGEKKPETTKSEPAATSDTKTPAKPKADTASSSSSTPAAKTA